MTTLTAREPRRSRSPGLAPGRLAAAGAGRAKQPPVAPPFARVPLPAPAWDDAPRRFRRGLLRAAALLGTAASAVLTADVLRPGRGFCPLEDACAKARGSSLGSVLGVPTALVGLVAFASLLALATLSSRLARRALRPAGLLAACAGAGLLAYQAFVLRAFCPFCVVADAAAVAAGLAVLHADPARAIAGAPPRASRVAWLLAGVVAIAAPMAWPRSSPPAWVPVPESALEPTLPPLREASADPVADAVVDPSSPPPVAAATVHAAPPASPAPIAEPVVSEPTVERARVEDVEASQLVEASADAEAFEDPEDSEAWEDPAGVGTDDPDAAPLPLEAPFSRWPPDVGDGTSDSDPPASTGESVPAPAPRAPPEPAAVVSASVPAPSPVAVPRAAADPDGDASRPRRPAAGARAAEVTIVEFLNPFCPHCRLTHARLDRVVQGARTPVRRYRVYVWSTGTPPLWAQACACAAAAGKEDALFAELVRTSHDSAASIWEAARRVGLDVAALQSAVWRGAAAQRLSGERQRVLASSVRLLPTLDVGRRRLEGEQSEAEIRAAIASAAADAEAAARGERRAEPR